MEEVIVFADTTTLYSLLDEEDANHQACARAWEELKARQDTLLTSNYVILETCALIQRRLGLGPMREFLGEFVPLLEIEWVLPEVHEAAAETLLLANKRDLSLVDCVSFVVMRRLRLEQAFTLDPHFREQGFECLPPLPVG